MAKLYFYYSAMNAGKTTTLLQSSYNYQERGMQTLVFTPAFNTRSPQGRISSRIGLERKALAFDENFNFYDYVAAKITSLERLACVLIDEAQFMTKTQVQQVVDITDFLKIPVLTYGLRTDFKGETFEGSRYLLAWAEELIEIKTICHCGRKATMNARMDEQGRMLVEGKQIEIGGNERYIALCRRHFHTRCTSSTPPSSSKISIA